MSDTKPSTIQHQQQQQHSSSSKKSLFAKAVWRENSCRFFVDRTTLKCEESVCLFRNEQKGCLLDCLHFPKNIKWSVYALLKSYRRGDDDGFQSQSQWRKGREKAINTRFLFIFQSIAGKCVQRVRLIKNTCLNFKQWDRF